MAASWLDEHLETFVRPHLGYVPNIETSNQWLHNFRPQALEELMKVWGEAKKRAKDKTILLPGRDTFLIEVLARILDDHPTLFKPEYSKVVSESGMFKEDYTTFYAVDSGYSGSVPKALKCADFGLVNGQHQLIMPLSHLSCASLEGSPKYWSKGTIENGKIFQELANNKDVFSTAAQLTRSVGKWMISNRD
jgi:hypothetical protein